MKRNLSELLSALKSSKGSKKPADDQPAKPDMSELEVLYRPFPQHAPPGINVPFALTQSVSAFPSMPNHGNATKSASTQRDQAMPEAPRAADWRQLLFDGREPSRESTFSSSSAPTSRQPPRDAPHQYPERDPLARQRSELPKPRKRDVQKGGSRALDINKSLLKRLLTSADVFPTLEEVDTSDSQSALRCFNTAIKTAGGRGDWRSSLKILFEDICRRGLVPNSISFNSAITACVKCQRLDEALQAFSRMKSFNVSPDEYSYGSVINGCGKAGKWQDALDHFETMRSSGIAPNIFTCNSLISACERGGQYERALELLDAMPTFNVVPDVISFSAAISACEKAGKWEKALELLARMQLRGIKPDQIAFGAAISACDKGSRFENALELLGVMKSNGIRPDLVCYSSAISACARCGEYQRALELLRSMEKEGVKPNILSYNSAINACAKAGECERALGLLDEAKARGLRLTQISYSTVISACDKASNWKLALRILSEMEDSRIEMDCVSFNSAMGACDKGEKYLKVLDLLDEMEKRGVRPSIISYTYALRAATKAQVWDRANAMIEEVMRRKIIDAYFLSAAVHALGDQQMLHRALRLIEVAELEHGARPNGGVINALISQAMHNDEFRMAVSIFKATQNSGVEVTDRTTHLCMRAHFKLGEYDEALDMLKRWSDYLVQPSEAMFFLGVEICMKKKDVSMASSFLRDMNTAGLVLTAEHLDKLLGMCEHSGLSDHTLELFEAAKSLRAAVTPDIAVIWIKMHTKLKMYDEALEKFERYRADLGSDGYGYALRALAKCGKADAALELLRELQGRSIPATSFCFESTIEPFALEGRWETVCALLEEMDELGLEAGHHTFELAFGPVFEDHGFSRLDELMEPLFLSLQRLPRLGQHALSTIFRRLEVDSRQSAAVLLMTRARSHGFYAQVWAYEDDGCSQRVDLRGCFTAEARAILACLIDELKAGECRGDVTVVTGKGKRKDAGPMLAVSSRDVIDELAPGLIVSEDTRNPGRFAITKVDIGDWLMERRRRSSSK